MYSDLSPKQVYKYIAMDFILYLTGSIPRFGKILVVSSEVQIPIFYPFLNIVKKLDKKYFSCYCYISLAIQLNNHLVYPTSSTLWSSWSLYFPYCSQIL